MGRRTRRLLLQLDVKRGKPTIFVIGPAQGERTCVQLIGQSLAGPITIIGAHVSIRAP